MDNNTSITCIGYSEEEEKALKDRFDWEEILSGADCFESYSKGIYELRADPAFANISVHKKHLTYHSFKQDFKILSGILSEELARYYSCSASVEKVSDAPAGEHFKVMLIHDDHVLDGQPDPGERREYYVISSETVFLYIKNSKRFGVYRYNEGAWQYDPSNSTVFAWDKPMGKLCGFLPGVTDPDICLDAFLSYSEELLMPNYFKSYHDFQQNLAELKEQYAGPSCALMLKCLQTANDSTYLKYPDFDNMDKRIDELNIHECMQYMLFYNRAPLKYGQEFYFTTWKSGKALRVIQRMRTLQQIEGLHFRQLGKEELYAKAFKECDRYFYSMKGLANDFTFPGCLMNKLKTLDRLKIEQKVIDSCLNEDTRFFDALSWVKYYDLSKVFTGEKLSKVTTIERRIPLLAVLYKITHNIDYLENLLRLAGGDRYAYFKVNELIKQDHQERLSQLDTDRYQRILRTLKTINIIMGAVWKRIDPTLPQLLYDKNVKPHYKKYKELSMLDPDDIRKICDVGTWCFKGCDKAIKFYSALYLRCRYLDTGTITFYKEIVSDALEYPEVYDIIQYMFRKGEVKEMIPVSSKAGSVKPVYMYVNPGAPFKAIRIVQGDICKLETDAIVVPTDSHCSGKGGLDLSVHKKAGEELRLYIDDYLKKKGGLDAGESIITPSFAFTNVKNIFFSVGPVWKDGFHSEEAQLARCYRYIIRMARENNVESIAFPCISTGVKQFPEQRAAEIALHTAYNAIMGELHKDPGCYKQGAVTFVCSSEEKYIQYRTIFKQMILDRGIQVFSPESNPWDFDYDLIMRLTELQGWKDPGDCYEYMKAVKEQTEKGSKATDETSAYAKTLHQWDYNTCLAYIVYLQRLAYWSGGMEHPLYDQIANGTIRRALCRMRKLAD